MLFLLFHIGNDRYAIAARDVVQVLPLLEVRPIPKAPTGVAGVFEFRRTLVPAIDLSLLTLGRPAPHCLSTRLIIVEHPGHDGRLLALIAEKVTRTVHWEPAAFLDCGITNDRALRPGPMTRDGAGFIQRITVADMLPAPIRDLFSNRSLTSDDLR